MHKNHILILLFAILIHLSWISPLKFSKNKEEKPEIKFKRADRLTDHNMNSMISLKFWNSHKKQYSLNFDNISDEMERYEIFHKNQMLIKKHNDENHSFTLKTNQFAHLTREEYINYVKNPQREKKYGFIGKPKTDNYDYMSVDPVDWRKEGIVTPVKDQKYCGSCWAFATTGAIESALKKVTKETVSLSEQQLVDCATEFFNQGCNGGYNDWAMAYVKKYGIETDSDYPYEAQDATCRYDKSRDLYRIYDFVTVDEGEEFLDQVLTDIGPAAVSIDASLDTFRFYGSGIYYDPACSSYELDHAVLAVGLDYDGEGNSYYIIKNSWGETWGDNGYIKIARNGKNHCGVATEPVYAIVNQL